MILEVNILSSELINLKDYMEITAYFEILAWQQIFSFRS